jgi:hypothetical protein
MTRKRLVQILTLAITTLAVVTAISAPAMSVGQTVTVYKTPT